MWTIRSFACWTCRVMLTLGGRCPKCGCDYNEMLAGVERLHPLVTSRELYLKRERN